MPETINDWVLERTGNPSYRQLADRIGWTASTVHRQVTGTMSIDMVVAVCRAYNLPTLDALVIGGFLTQSELDAHGAAHAVATASTVELTQEMLRRAITAEVVDAGA